MAPASYRSISTHDRARFARRAKNPAIETRPSKPINGMDDAVWGSSAGVSAWTGSGAGAAAATSRGVSTGAGAGWGSGATSVRVYVFESKVAVSPVSLVALIGADLYSSTVVAVVVGTVIFAEEAICVDMFLGYANSCPKLSPG